MNLKVSIEYKTAWGEELVLCLGGKRYPLTYVADGIWEGEVSRLNAAKTYEYSYEVVRDGQTVRKEWKGHFIAATEGAAPKAVTIYDRWHDRPADSPFYSSAFTNAIFGRNAAPAKVVKKTNAVLKVAVPSVRPGEVLALAGTGMGDWSKVIPFSDASFPVWSLAFEVEEVFEYKLLIADKNTFRKGDTIKFSVNVTNTGDCTGKETVLLYSSDLVASMIPDVKRLRAFEKVELHPGETKTVDFVINADELAFAFARAGAMAFLSSVEMPDLRIKSSNFDTTSLAILPFFESHNAA